MKKKIATNKKSHKGTKTRGNTKKEMMNTDDMDFTDIHGLKNLCKSV